MEKHSFTVILTQEEEDPEIINVDVPELPGCFTFGRGRAQALKHASDVIRLFLESMGDEESGTVLLDVAEVEVAA